MNVLKLLHTILVPTRRMRLLRWGPSEGGQQVDGLLQGVEGPGPKLGDSSSLPSSEGTSCFSFPMSPPSGETALRISLTFSTAYLVFSISSPISGIPARAPSNVDNLDSRKMTFYASSDCNFNLSSSRAMLSLSLCSLVTSAYWVARESFHDSIVFSMYDARNFARTKS